ncbi:MAG: hypothetical protein LLG01_12565 [Planctomycetaceae bacterium]|nr:hypothetical protein [Planctomycetaceae bacterium]
MPKIPIITKHRLTIVAAILVLTAAGVAYSRGKRGPAPMPVAVPSDGAVVVSLRAAVEDLGAAFGEGYPRGKEFLARLGEVEKRLTAGDEPARAKAKHDLAALQREALVANPLVSAQPLLYVARRQFPRDHHNTATMFQTGEINTGSFNGVAGGALKTLDLKSGKVTVLLDLPAGIVRDPVVSFDGKRILVSMRRDIRDDYHLYEMNADGSGLRQLTFGRGLSDIDPLYLSDGRIAFTSTREPKFCQCNRHIMGNLWVMEADGANPIQIGHSTLHEGHGTLTPDGRILYDRWEYVDRNFGDAQALWTCNPDGTNHALYWGNNTASAQVIDARVIPGSEGSRVMAILGSCHDRPWGALAIIDRRRGLNGREPIVRTWPPAAADMVSMEGAGRWDTMMRVPTRYEDPYPLGDDGKYFLVSRLTGPREQMSLVLLDIFGNEIVLHNEAPGCYDPMPLAARPRPSVVPDRVDLRKSDGAFYIANVYRGTGMETVKPGAVKYLRVVESPEKRHWTHPAYGGQGSESPAMGWHDFINKRILGTVNVEADGSAYFNVPADRFVYFQLLDEQGMMIQSMRSGTMVRPGETQGCVGCHDDRRGAAPNSPLLAMARPAQQLQPWYGPARTFSYYMEVQPVFDRNCVSCHDYGKPAGEKVNLSGGPKHTFNVSYSELWSKRLVGSIGAGPSQVQMPYSWGSHASKLMKVVRSDHHGVKLDKESYDRLVTWIDINGPYYNEYATAYRDNRYGRSPLSDEELGRLHRAAGNANDVDFGRPDKSPCLKGLKEKDPAKYQEALAIIRGGAERMLKRPGPEMPGFKYDGEEARRQNVYEQMLGIEQQARKALIEGRKFYPFKDVK